MNEPNDSILIIPCSSCTGVYQDGILQHVVDDNGNVIISESILEEEN